MPIRRIGNLAANFVLSCFFFSLVGKEQHLNFDTDTDVYRLTFDDRQISLEEMQRIAWLSPLIDPDVPHAPFMMTGGREGQHNFQKFIIALPLGTCMPGYAECRNEPVLDKAYLRNAARVLNKSHEQLALLRGEPLPVVLEPVRSYLVLTLQTSIGWEEAEYAYLRNSNMGPVREQFCEYCSCTGDLQSIEKTVEEKHPRLRGAPEWAGLSGLLERMAVETDPQKRLTLATHDFENAMVYCFVARDPGYPVQAWQKFLHKYEIQETWKPKRVE